MVDSTDFQIQEPSQFGPMWYSHNFKHPGLHYGVGVCIKTWWIVWINGPLTGGEWSNLLKARSGIIHHLMECTMTYFPTVGGDTYRTQQH